MWLVTDSAGDECLPWLPQRIFASAAITPTTPAKWATTPSGNHPFFTKPLSSLCPAEGDWHLPDFSKQVEHEVELVLGLKVPPPARPPCECRRRQGLDRRRRLGY